MYRFAARNGSSVLPGTRMPFGLRDRRTDISLSSNGMSAGGDEVLAIRSAGGEQTGE